ncbi:MAG: MarC family protein [Bacteroidales bacterium]|jgi:small neutral amino acid transporter SnatA (MarC family)|nr:MarC family protein [Bacteroidales bacterium]
MSVNQLILSFLTALAALFPVINPIGSGFIINGFFKDLDAAGRKLAAKKIIINCLMISLGCMAAGHFIILIFGISIPIIQIGGGIVICKTAWDLLSDSKSTDNSGESNKSIKVSIKNIEGKLFYPIAFPITVGAGTISVIFTLMATASVKDNLLLSVFHYIGICVAIFLLLAVLYILVSQGDKLTKRLGYSGNIVINKLVAFITFCVGIQILIKGISGILMGVS